MDSQVDQLALVQLCDYKCQPTMTVCFLCRLLHQAPTQTATAQLLAQMFIPMVLWLALMVNSAQWEASVMIHKAHWLMKPSASTLPHTAWVQAELHWQAAALLTLRRRQIAITNSTYTALHMTIPHWDPQEQPQHMRQGWAVSSGVSRSAVPQSWEVKAPTLSSHCHMIPLLHSNSSMRRLL